MLSVQECEVDDTEERISELFFLAATTDLDSLRFLGRFLGSTGLVGGRGSLVFQYISPGAEDEEPWEEMESLHHICHFWKCRENCIF